MKVWLEGFKMARPRKQTYTLDMYLKKNKKGVIDNNADVQRNFVWNNAQINELIVTVLTDDYIPPIILGEEEDTKLHIVDGGCRTAALRKFREMNYKITSSVENALIPYKKKVIDKKGNVTYEDAVCDIRNKTFEKLPGELQEKFDEYQIETVIHESCDSAQISGYIKRYNNHVAMNTDQRAFTYIDRFAGRIREILDNRFFVECTGYSEKDKTKGTVERMVVEAMMCMNHLNAWKTKPGDACKYLNVHATEEEFDIFEEYIQRLEKVITEDIRDVFSKKEAFVFLALFARFAKLQAKDEKFADFLREFISSYRQSSRNEKGLLFDEIDKKLNTKSKQVVTDKLAMLEGLMVQYLQNDSKPSVTAKDIIEEYVDASVDDRDMELYELLANEASEVIGDIDSRFLSDENRPSFVALVSYAAGEDTDQLLKEWLAVFEKQGNLFPDQEENFLHMKAEYDKYLVKYRASA